MAKSNDRGTTARAQQATAGEVFHITLAKSIHDDAGREWSELSVAEPTLAIEARAQRGNTTTQVERTIALFALLTGVPDAAIRRLTARDARRINAWLSGLAKTALEADTIAESADPGFDPLNSPRTFQLIVPVLTDGVPLTQIVVREPDLASGIAVEKMTTEADRTAAMIAQCAGLIVPVAHRMAMRDVRRIERWLNFFFLDGDDMHSEQKDPRSPEVESRAGEMSP